MKKKLSIIAIGLVSLFSSEAARGQETDPANVSHSIAVVSITTAPTGAPSPMTPRARAK